MKQLMFADKALLVDDVTADLLVEYAAILVQHGTGDSVDLHALSMNGDELEVKFLLSAGAPLMTETSRMDLPVPTNDEACDYMRAGILRLQTRPTAHPSHEPIMEEFDPYEI